MPERLKLAFLSVALGNRGHKNKEKISLAGPNPTTLKFTAAMPEL
jgi:hypothetical protein